ncbi:MAG TPA: NAD(P)-binding protein [Nocardioidaceae bacterium]|nr:NAD(P)-binding protein [Nocardioidaceae bacterium]
MRELETDYLVVGAGASGMAFTDALVARSDVEVILVDQRHRPGGHWLDAYPFVRLHQPSATYGVDSSSLGRDEVDEDGPNAGFYERASAAEICAYFGRVLDDVLLPTGRVDFRGMTSYEGSDEEGHLVRSLLSGEVTRIRTRHRLVDATYVESEVPSRRPPAYHVDEGVHLVPPNELVHLGDAPAGFTVIGAGKTGMDTCNWLLEEGVGPDRITWVKSREGWFFDRAFMQPLDQVASYMQMQAHWVAAAATAEHAVDFAHRLEDADVFVRVDEGVEPTAFRGATVSRHEVAQLRSIENVVRGRVRALTAAGTELDGGSVAARPGGVYVDCTAPGVRPTEARPLFEPGRITVQYVTPGWVCWSAAIVGTVEALLPDDAARNQVCVPVRFSGSASDLLEFANASLTSVARRGAQPEISGWNDRTRLNPAASIGAHLDDPRVLDALGSLGKNIGPAVANLARLAGSV